MTEPKPQDLLEPGALLSGALMRSFTAALSAQDLLSAGTRLGPFRIVEEIGRGGMGIVYRAERDDGSYQQPVAIKCVIQAESESRTELFRRERQILADLKHPHIARLLDGGRDDSGRLWLAMELIEGQRIDQHVHTQNLGVDARIRLLLQVIEAVEAAHARLLMHRDIKPSNVLVDADGRAKLLDFGIAALIDDGAAARAYSPRWASPEQHAREAIGPASDQYQLALLLDAMLAAPDPLAHERVDDQQRPIDCARWPAMPVSRRDELHAALRKATSAAPAARYGSVREFGDDLEHWLARRPVAARNGGLGYVLACAIRRRPLLSAFLATSVIAGLSLAFWFNLRVAEERDIANAQRLRAEQEAATASEVSRFLQDDLLALADPNLSQEPDLKVSALLARASHGVTSRFATRPDIAMQIHTTLGRSLRGLGDFDAAQDQFESAQVLAAATLPERDPRRLALDLWHADLELARSEPAAAYARLERVLSVAERELGSHAELTLEAAVRLQAARFEVGKEQPAALEALDALQPRLDSALGVDAPLSIFALNRRAVMLNSLEHLEDSQAVRVEHLARATRAYGGEHSTTLTSRLNHAVLLRKLGQPEAAMREAEVADAGLRKVFGVDSIAALHGMNVRSRILLDLGQTDAAIALQREVLAGRIRLLGPNHDDVAYSYVNLGGNLVQAKQFDAAVDAFMQALKIRREKLDADHIDIITNLTLLGDTERLRGRLDSAAAYLREALERAQRTLTADRPELANALFRYAQVLHAQGQDDAAREPLKTAIDIYVAKLGPQHARTQAARELLAKITR